MIPAGLLIVGGIVVFGLGAVTSVVMIAYGLKLMIEDPGPCSKERRRSR